MRRGLSVIVNTSGCMVLEQEGNRGRLQQQHKSLDDQKASICIAGTFKRDASEDKTPYEVHK